MENNQENKSFIKRIFSDKKVWLIAAIIVVILAMIGQSAEKNSQVSQNPKPIEIKATENKVTENSYKEVNKIGDEAYLRNGGNSVEATSIVFLSTTEAGHEQLVKSLMAKDTQGVIDNPTVFGVSSGTKVLVIDSKFGIRKVRIIKGVRDVDQDKVGRTGWVVKEFVVNK